MYDLEYLPMAHRDMAEIARYISHDLMNPNAAERLAEEMVEAIEDAGIFPYAAPPHIPIRPLKHEYRKLIVKNHLVFCWVDEQAKKLTVARAVYAKRDSAQRLT